MSYGWHQLWKHATGAPERPVYSFLWDSPPAAFQALLNTPRSTRPSQHLYHTHSSNIIFVPQWAFSPKWSHLNFSFSSPSVGALQLACTLTVFMLPIFSFSSNVSSSLSFVVNKISRHAAFWKQTRQSGKMKTTITATDVPQRERSNAFPLPVYLWKSQLIEWK